MKKVLLALPLNSINCFVLTDSQKDSLCDKADLSDVDIQRY
jgi:hypothetical protein